MSRQCVLGSWSNHLNVSDCASASFHMLTDEVRVQHNIVSSNYDFYQLSHFVLADMKEDKHVLTTCNSILSLRNRGNTKYIFFQTGCRREL